MCDQAEFDPSADDLPQRVWVDRNGKRVPTTVLSSAFGSDHCDWETVTFLSLRGRQFVGDPHGALDKLAVEKLAAYREDTKLPADATDTGYRLDGRELWRAADGHGVFVVTDHSVEQWPALKEPLFCR